MSSHPLSAPLPSLSHDALSPEERRMLAESLVETKKDQELYLRRHPEVAALITAISKSVVEQRPADVYAFTSDFFSGKNEAQLRAIASEARTGLDQ